MALWTPARLQTALKGWWKADAITGLSDGAAVSSWTDSSGNGNTLVQATGGVEPTIDLADLNGLNVVDFASASSQRLEIASTFGITSQPFSVYAVWFMAVAANQSLIHFETGTASDNFNGLGGSGTLQCSNSSAFTAAITRGAWRMTATGFNGGSSGSWLTVDGGTRTAGSIATTANNNTKTTVGSALDEASFFLNGSIAELLITNTAVTQTDEDKIFGYFAHKWGLTASLGSSHPYKSSPPFAGGSGLRYALGTGLRNRVLGSRG